MSVKQPATIVYDVTGTHAAAVKDASTAPAATDKALVTALSPNGNQATEATLALVKAKTDNLDVALSTRASQATVATLLTQSDFDTRVGEVQASPTANTVLGRLKDLYDALVARLGTLGQKPMASSTPVVLASDQSTVPVSQAVGPVSADRVVTDTLTALNDTVEIETTGCGVVAAQITGSWVGTIVAEATINGTDWFPIVGYITGDAQTAVGSTQVNGQFRAVCVGFYKCRLRASAWTSGTATATGRASVANSIARANIGQTAYDVPGNSTTTPLGASGVFTGSPEVCISTMGIQINVFSDKDSASKGLRVEQSMNGVHWDIVDHFTVLANEGFSRTIQSTATYCRVVYTNGPNAQTVFRLQLVLVPMVEALPRSTGHGGGLFVEPSESPTFTVLAPDVTLGNNKSLLSLCLAAGDPRVLRLREVWIRNAINSAVTGVAASFEMRRITGHSGGTALTPATRDTDDTLPAGVTARAEATVSGEGALEQRWEWSSDEWGPGTLDVEAQQLTHQNLVPALRKHDPQVKPPTIRAGQGYHIKCATNTTAGAFDLLFVFTVET